MSAVCTLDEMMILALARTIEDGSLVFHGFGSPLVQLAMHVAKRTHAPNMTLVAGATYGIDPQPPFLSPTSNDWVMDRGASAALDIEELFDLAAAGRMGRMFLSGLQIDRWGNCNVTALGVPHMRTKLPGGGGGGNLSCDATRLTLWTAAHRSPPDAKGLRRFRLVESCDFITNLGHRAADGRRRSELGHRGAGPQWLVSELGVFDFDADGFMRLRAVYPDVSIEEALENSEFEPRRADTIEIVAPPEPRIVEFIRRLDPLDIRQREIRAEDRRREFPVA